MELWLSMDARGMYVLTEKPTIRAEVDGTGRDDVYFAIGDGLGLRYLCPGVVEAVFAGTLKLRRFQAVRVRLVGEVVGEVSDVCCEA